MGVGLGNGTSAPKNYPRFVEDQFEVCFSGSTESACLVLFRVCIYS